MSSTRRTRRLAIAGLLAAIASGCGSNVASTGPPKPIAEKSSATSPYFRAQTLPFRYERGLSGKALPQEVTGGGVGLLDFDGDGDLDIFFAQGVPLPVGSSKNPPADVLLRNDGDGTFTDISAQVGLTSKGYGQGVCIADFDGDGDPDVYVTRCGSNSLYRNDGGKTFTDVAEAAGVAVGSWSLGAAFFDFDGDGDLDLFVANYFKFDPSKAPFDRDDTGRAEYGMPHAMEGLPDTLFRNDGSGKFTDVTATAKIADKSRGMGVLAADFDGDRLMDILVANDAEANILWRNTGDGTFEEVANAWGIAYNGQGQHEANMGIARGDTDEDGLQDIFVTHYVNEHDTLWRPLKTAGGGVIFDDQTTAAGLGLDSRPMTGWGVAMADFDADGLLDIVVANGHIRRQPEQDDQVVNPPLCWKGLKGGKFANASSGAGPYFQGKHEGRGVACGDLDGDGDLDLVVTHLDGPAVVLWNDTPRAGKSVIVELSGTSPNTDAIGATITAKIGSRTMIRTIDGGGGYLSAHAKAVHFGIADAESIDTLEVRWPSGKVEVREAIRAGGRVKWVEGRSGSSDR